MTTIIIPLTTKEIELKEILEKMKSLKSFKLNFLILCEKKHKIVSEFEKFKQKVDEQLKEVVKETSKKATKENTETSKKSNKNLKNHKEKANINLYTFPNGTKEDSMISFGINSLTEGDFILLRNDVEEINVNLIEKILFESQLGGDIIMAKKPRKKNFLNRFFSNVFEKLYFLIFNFIFYAGDIGVQYFSNLTLSIMKETNSVMLTKLNKWLAVDIKYLDFEINQTVIKQKNYGKSKLLLLIYALCFVVLIVLSFILSDIFNPSFIFWLFVAFLIIVFAILIMVTVFRIRLIYRIGDIRASSVHPILRSELWIDMKNLQETW